MQKKVPLNNKTLYFIEHTNIISEIHKSGSNRMDERIYQGIAKCDLV